MDEIFVNHWRSSGTSWTKFVRTPTRRPFVGNTLRKVSSPCLDDHQFKMEELESVGELSGVCSQIVLKCLYQHEWVDQTSYGHQANLLDPSQNGREHVTDDWHAWCPTFITQVTTGNIVMWVTRLNIVDWVYSKTQTLLEILKNQNQHQAEFCAFLEVKHLYPLVGCVRSKRQCPTFLQKQKLFRWLLDWERTTSFGLLWWDVVIEVLRSSNSTKSPKTKPAAGNCLRDPERDRTSNPNRRETETLINCRMWITSQQTHTLLKVSLSCTSFKTMKLWKRWPVRADVQQWDTFQELTGLR